MSVFGFGVILMWFVTPYSHNPWKIFAGSVQNALMCHFFPLNWNLAFNAAKPVSWMIIINLGIINLSIFYCGMKG